MQPTWAYACNACVAAAMAAMISAPAAVFAESTVTGVSRAFNPALSLNGLFLFGVDDRDGPSDDLTDGFQVQEVEMRLGSVIDAYSKADATLAFSDGEVAFEEVYIRSTAVGHGVGLRAGRFYVPFSLENTTHTHQLPFVRKSLMEGAILEENFGDTGVELSWLPPTPFYTELSGAVFDGSQAEWFDSTKSSDFVYNARLSSLFDLGESTTLSLGGGMVTGRNSGGGSSTLSSVETTIRWRPARRAIYRSFRAHAEYSYADRGGRDDTYAGGLNSLVQFQFARRWWAGVRYENYDPMGQVENTDRVTAQLAFVPSEFQALRAELSRSDGPFGENAEFFVQYNFTIGSHPAHRY